MAVLKAAHHAYIVRLHEVVHTPAGTYLVMELLRGGELFDTIVQKGCFTEEEARRVMRQLLQVCQRRCVRAPTARSYRPRARTCRLALPRTWHRPPRFAPASNRASPWLAAA